MFRRDIPCLLLVRDARLRYPSQFARDDLLIYPVADADSRAGAYEAKVRNVLLVVRLYTVI